MKRLFAAAAALACVTHAACAGQMTLFSDSDFRGNQVTVRGPAPNLSDIGFNDRASSIVVQSGTWQICEHDNFGGYCAELGPGEYRNLSNMNDRISSVREVGYGGRGHGPEGYRGGEYDRRGDRDAWRDDHRDDYRGERRGEYRGEGGWRGGELVQMFAGPRFEGAQIGLSGNVRTLNDVGFNDRAGSLIIREGSWEFCEHADFRGQCVVYGPGNYPFLQGMNNRISSMRRVR